MDLVDIIMQMDKLGLASLKVAEVPTSFWGLNWTGHMVRTEASAGYLRHQRS
jgi:hypothetical protein